MNYTKSIYTSVFWGLVLYFFYSSKEVIDIFKGTNLVKATIECAIFAPACLPGARNRKGLRAASGRLD